MFSKIKLYLVVGIISIIGIGVLISTFIPKNNTILPTNTQKPIYNASGNFGELVQELRNIQIEPKLIDFNYSKNPEDYIIAQTNQTNYYKIPLEIAQNISELKTILVETKESEEPEKRIGDLVLKKEQGKDFEEVEDLNYFAFQDTIYQITNSYADKDGLVQEYKTFFVQDQASKFVLDYKVGEKLLKVQTIEEFAYLTIKNQNNGLDVLKVDPKSGKNEIILENKSDIVDIIKNLDAKQAANNEQIIVENEPTLNIYYNKTGYLILHSSYYQDRYFVVKNDTFEEILSSPKPSQMICRRENCLAILVDKIIKLNDSSTFATRNTPKIPKMLQVPIYSWVRWNEQVEIFENGIWQKF